MRTEIKGFMAYANAEELRMAVTVLADADFRTFD
jgi:hypothetical protein